MSADRAPDGPRLAELPPEVRDRLSDEVIDELLAGARTEEEIVGPGRVAGRPHPPAGGAGDGGRADRAPRLRATSGAARRRREHPQRFDAQDASDRARAAGDQSRDRNDSFEPQLVRKGQRRFEGFDEKILALYARGLSTRDIEAHLAATPTPPSRRSSASTSSGGERFPVITQAWLDAWEHVTPFLAFPPEVRRVIYTTNAIEALNRQLRKALKAKGHFPNEEAARKLIYLAITNAVPAWTRTRSWATALLAFKIHFGDRLPD